MQEENTLPSIPQHILDESQKDHGRLFLAVSKLRSGAADLQKKLTNYTDDELKVIFDSLDEAENVAWMLQSDVVVEFQSRAGFGEGSTHELAVFLGKSERRIQELGQVGREILTPAPHLRDSPLDKSHYVEALRAKRYDKSPIKMLERAHDENLGVREMRRMIESAESNPASPTVTTYYSTAKINTPIKREDVKQVKYLSPSSRLVEYLGKVLLEIKEFVQ